MIVSTISSKYVRENGLRFEGEYYLNRNSYLSMQIEKHSKRIRTLESVATVFNPPVFKRQFCCNTFNSVPYFQSSDVPNAEERSSTFVYKGQAESLNLLVKEGDILVTGFGSIGNTKIVSKFQDGSCYANNVCRIRITDTVERDVVYAFLSSKYGFAQLNKHASGSVVRYIEAPGIKKVLIPSFETAFSDKVSLLISDAVRLRVEAIEALEKSHQIIEGAIKKVPETRRNSVSIRSIFNSHNKRFEGSYYISHNRQLYDHIQSHFECDLLKDCTEKIFRPGIFKRNYVQNGVTFLGGADIMLAIPSSDKKLSYKQVESMPELKVNKGWILATCGGTIGNTIYVDDQIAQCVISQHVMRIVPKETASKEYLFAFLSSSIGHELITMFTYGAVIPQVEPHHLGLIPIPKISKEDEMSIKGLINEYAFKLDRSKALELEAIKLVETEIEQWNKN